MNYKIVKYRVAYNPSGWKHYAIQAYVVETPEVKSKTKTKSKTTKDKAVEETGEWFGWNKMTSTWEFGTHYPRCYFTKCGAEKALDKIMLLGW